MNCVAAILFIFYILAIMYMVKQSIKTYLSTQTKFVLINAKKTNSIEYTVRYALTKYVDREIYVINKSPDDEMKIILKKLEYDNERVHVINMYYTKPDFLV